MPDDPNAGTPVETAQKADGADGGWTVESHSAPSDPTPADTTAEAQHARPAAPAPSGADDDPDREGEVDDPTEGQPAHARDPKTGQFAKTTPPKRVEKKKLRYEEVDRARHDAERRAASAEARAQDLERRIAALEKGAPAKPAPAPAAKPAAKPAEPAAALPEMPEHPKYADFVTDEEYHQAVAKWRTDMAAWQTTREEALKTSITSSVDERLKRDRAAAAAEAHQQTVIGRIKQVFTANPQLHANMREHAEVYRSITPEKAPFVYDLIENRDDGGEFFRDLAESPDLAEALVALPLPTRPLADAVRQSPAARTLMKHFATDEGREDFLRLRSLHPVRVLAEIGKLEAALEAADRGSAPAATPITSAIPPAKPPVGSPRARTTPGGGPQTFEAWMAAEDAKEDAERKKTLGLSASA